jgi:hypothetical protein
MKVKFKKNKQREFIKKVIESSNSFSLRELARRLEVNYASLKNNFVERRLLGEDLFDQLCFVGEVDKNKFKVDFVEENWGQVLGGRCGKRKKKI